MCNSRNRQTRQESVPIARTDMAKKFCTHPKSSTYEVECIGLFVGVDFVEADEGRAQGGESVGDRLPRTDGSRGPPRCAPLPLLYLIVLRKAKTSAVDCPCWSENLFTFRCTTRSDETLLAIVETNKGGQFSFLSWVDRSKYR